MKDKIFNLLKQTYSNLGLSDDILQGQAEALANTGLVTDDNLQAVVDGQKSFLSSLQSGIDKRVTDAVNKAKGEKKEESAAGGGQTKTEPDFQKLIDEAIAAKLSPIQEELNAYKAKDQQTARANMIASKAKELGISTDLMKIIHVPNELDEKGIGDYLIGVKEYDVTRGLENGKGFPLGSNKEASTEQIDAVVDKLPI